MSDTEKELLDALLDMVRQHCAEYRDGDPVRGMYNSGFLSSDAWAIRLLIRHGILQVIDDSPTRWVSAKEPLVVPKVTA